MSTLDIILLVVLLYASSLVERQFINIDFEDKNKKRMILNIGKGFVFYVICAGLILVLISANTRFLTQ